MAASNRRLGRSPVRRSTPMQLHHLERDYLLHHGALGHSPHTVIHYERSFRVFHRFLDMSEYDACVAALATPRLNEFARWLRETPTKAGARSEATIHGILIDLRAFTRSLHEEGHLSVLPKVPMNKLPQVFFEILSDEELARAFATKQLDPKSEIGARNRALIAFMLDTGVRRAELANLTVTELNLEEGQARIYGKGRKERLVFFAPATRDLLKKWLAIRGEEPGTVFWLSYEGVKMLFNRIKREAGLKSFHPHQIRHTTATKLLAGGADTHSVRRMLGHSSVLTTERYLSMGAGDLKAKHTSASPYEGLSSQLETTPIRGKRRLKTA